jgi:WD40 repeat protein
VELTPESVKVADTTSTPPETPPEEVAIVTKTAEPRPVEPAGDRAPRVRPAAPDVAKPKAVAKIPTYDVSPIFTKHKGVVNSVAVTGNGEIALSAGADHTARLWQVATGKQILELPVHASPILDVAITPDGLFALTVTRGKPNTNGNIRLWNLRTRQPVFTGTGEPHTGPIVAVAFVPNGRALSGGHLGHAVLWNVRLGRPIGTLGSQKAIVRSHALAVFPLGQRALTGAEDGIVRVWNLRAREQSGQWNGHEGPISDLAISPDGRRAASGSHDHSVNLWDAVHGSQVRRFMMPGQDRAKGIAILPDGNVLAAGLFGHLVLWDADTGAIIRQARPPLVPHQDLTVLPPDGRRVLTADHDGMVRIWTPRPREP